MKSRNFNQDLSYFKIHVFFIFLNLIILSYQTSIIHQTQDEAQQNTLHKKAFEFYQKGKIHYKESKLQEAVKQFQKSIELNQNHKQSYFELGTAHFYLNNFEQAKKVQQKALQLDSSYKQAYNGLGNAQLKLSFIQKAKKMYMKAIELDSLYPNPYNGLGSAFHQQNNHTQAIKYYKKAIQVDEHYIKAYHNLKKLYYQLQMYQQILQIQHKKYLKIEKKENIIKLIQTLRQIKNPTNCSKIIQFQQKLNHQIKLNHQNWESEYSKTLAFLQQYLRQQYQICLTQKVTQIYQNFIKQVKKEGTYPSDSTYTSSQSQINNFNETFRYLNIIFSLPTNNDMIQCAQIKVINKDDKQILSNNFEQSRQFDNIFNELVYIQIADCFYSYGKYQMASKIYENVLKKNQSSSEVLTKLANTQKYLGLLDLAQQNYKTSIKLDQNHIQAYIGYYQLFVIIQKYSEAKNLLKKGIQKNMKNIQFYQHLRNLQHFLYIKSYTQTKNALFFALQTDPDWDEGVLQLIQVYKITGQYQNALKLVNDQIEKITLSSENEINSGFIQTQKELQETVKHFTEQQKLLQSSIRANITSKWLFETLAQQFSLAKKTEKSIIAYQKVLQIDQLSAKALHALGTFYCQNGKYWQGLLLYERILSISSYANYYLLNMSKCALKLTQVLKLQQQKLNSNANRKEITSILNQKMLYVKQIWKRLKQKIQQKDFYSYIRQDINFNIAQMYLMENENQKAIQIYENIKVQAYYDIIVELKSNGNLFFLRKNYDKAIVCFQYSIDYRWFPQTFDNIIDNFRKIHKIVKIQKSSLSSGKNSMKQQILN